jgi:hypothetical protein
VTAGNAVQHSAAQDVVQLKDVTARVMLKDGPAILTTQQGAYDFGGSSSPCPAWSISKARTAIA